MARLHTYFLLFVSFITLSLATVPSFCKCTCFSQSGIIPLNPPSINPASETPAGIDSTRALLARFSPLIDIPRSLLTRSTARAPTGSSKSASCTKCNRAFCLAQDLPFCTDATESDVFTACFSRDSEKDMIIVWGFILATVGLLGWAGVRQAMDRRRERESAGGGEYERVGGR